MAFIDLSPLKSLTERLQEKDRELKRYECIVATMCDALPLMVWAKDVEERYLFANKTVCEVLLNTSADDIIGQTDMDVARRERAGHEHDNCPYHTFGEACHESDQFVLATGKSYRRIEEGYAKGEKLIINVRKFPLWDNDGKLIGVAGCANLVTEEKRRFDDYHPLETKKVSAWQRPLCKEEIEVINNKH